MQRIRYPAASVWIGAGDRLADIPVRQPRATVGPLEARATEPEYLIEISAIAIVAD
jgi:hypothetical protein